MKIISRAEIERILPKLDLVTLIEEGFRAYSAGKSVVPPVGELILDRGEVHIKYGYIQNQEYYVIKIASGFFRNSEVGLPTGQGMMLVFSQATGVPVCLLQDEGYLTDIRTAIAGAISAKYLAPKKVERIGIVGSGVQARLQLSHLESITPCRKALIWGRSPNKLAEYERSLEDSAFEIETTPELPAVQESCNLIVTTTPSKLALLKTEHLRAGTHITAVGSDTPEKQELEAGILSRADVVVADSISQCLERGEIHQAIKTGEFSQQLVQELGNIISGQEPGRTSDDQITVADLTGVAVQDIQIATAVYQDS